MIPGIHRSRIPRWSLAATLCIFPWPLHAALSTPQPRTPAEYLDHLKTLEALIVQCEHHTNPAHCNADAIGLDDIVTLPNQKTSRRISYDWLRALLAGNHTIHPADGASMLQAAAQRIKAEESEAISTTSATLNYTAQRTALISILDRREFRRADRSLTQRVLEAIAIWINRRLASLIDYSSHRRWLALLLQWGVIALACLALGYWFVRQVCRARALQAEERSQVENAPALRSWERLRQEAEQATRQQRWREAVRAYYWATIARFESRGQWPTDRARTPREYLRLIVPGAPKHDDLRRLTQCFETCWYGSDTANQPDCETARLLFERLVAR